MDGFGELGIGIGWRPELALTIDRYPGLGFVELTAENHGPDGPLPAPVARLVERGVKVVVHGVSLSLGGAEPLDGGRLRRLASLAARTGAPLVSEHIAFVRAGGLEAGHLLPVPPSRDSVEVLVENVAAARAALSVPFALENIATLLEWPEAEVDEAAFVTEVLRRTDSLLLLDLSNVHANARNHGLDAHSFLDALPLDRLAYVHVWGGIERDGLFHDTHAHPLDSSSLDLLEELAARVEIPGAMLERDDDFDDPDGVARELDQIREAVRRGAARRVAV
jgi:uncharacterized protein (UPF0276 family)